MSTDCIFRSETSEETEEDSCSSLEMSSRDVLVDLCSDDTTAGQIKDTSDAKGYLPNSIAFKLACPTEDKGHDETILKVNSSETSQRGNASAKTQKEKAHNAKGKRFRRQGSMRSSSQHPDADTRKRRLSKTDLKFPNTPEDIDKIQREEIEYQERVDIHGREGDSQPASWRRGSMHNAKLRAKERIDKRLSDMSSNLEKHIQESSDTKIREGDVRSKSRRRGSIDNSGHSKEVISSKRLSSNDPGDQDLEDSSRSRKNMDKLQRQESSGSTKYQENTPTRSKGKKSRSKSRRSGCINNSGHSKEIISSKRRSSTGSADQDLQDYLPQLRNTDNPQENSESSNYNEKFDMQLKRRDSRAKSRRRGSMNNSGHHQKANTINRCSSTGSADLDLNNSSTSRRKKNRLRRQESSGSNQYQEKGNSKVRERDTRCKSRQRGSIDDSGHSTEVISSKLRPSTGPGDRDLQDSSLSRKNKDRLRRQESSGSNKYQDNTNTQDPKSDSRSKSRRRWSSMKNSAHHPEANATKRRFSTGSVDQDIQSDLPQFRSKDNPQENSGPSKYKEMLETKRRNSRSKSRLHGSMNSLWQDQEDSNLKDNPQENSGSSKYKEMLETKGRNSRSKVRLHGSMNSLCQDQEDSNRNVYQSLHNSTSSFKNKEERWKGKAAFRDKGKRSR